MEYCFMSTEKIHSLGELIAKLLILVHTERSVSFSIRWGSFKYKSTSRLHQTSGRIPAPRFTKKKSFRISVLPKSQALIKSRSKLKLLNLNRLLLSGKNRNYRKSRKPWESFSRISLRYSMFQRSVQTYFWQKGNLFLSQKINKSTLANHSFSSKYSQGFRPISSQVTPYGAPPEV